jgi:hypothetical protein
MALYALGDLRLSFESARAAGHNRFIMFLHYPATDILEETSCFCPTNHQTVLSMRQWNLE